MKISFKLIVLGSEVNARLNKLKAICAEANVSLCEPEKLLVLPAEELAQQVIFIAGDSTSEELLALVNHLADADAVPILLVDAWQLTAADLDGNSPALFAKTVASLLEARIQTAVVAQVSGLLACKRPMLYRFPKADVTTTIMVIIGSGTASARVLTITRLHPPYQDQESFPGGFLNPHAESVPGCGAREGSEETGVTVPQADLILLDVRSGPERDQRGHVVDHGYMWLVPTHLSAAVEASVQAGDDAKAGSARFVSVAALLDAGSMAFDHYDLLLAAVRTGRVLPPRSFVVSILRNIASFFNRLALSFEI